MLKPDNVPGVETILVYFKMLIVSEEFSFELRLFIASIDFKHCLIAHFQQFSGVDMNEEARLFQDILDVVLDQKIVQVGYGHAHGLDLLRRSQYKLRVLIRRGKLKLHATMLMRDLLGVESQVELAEHVLKLDPLSICDLPTYIHLQFELIILEFISKNLIILFDGFLDPFHLPVKPINLIKFLVSASYRTMTTVKCTLFI